jgi:hypothetical protein
MPCPFRSNGLAVLVASAAVATFAGCSGSPARARDVAGDRRTRSANNASSDAGAEALVPQAPQPEGAAVRAPSRARAIAKASARALALGPTHLFYGDSEDDGVYSIAKSGGEPLRIARHAPISGALAFDGAFVTWVASPGDAVLRAPVAGGVQPTTLRDRGIFSDVAAIDDDVFITEAVGAGGAVIRVTGATASRLAAIEAPPRTVMVDKTDAFIVTPTKIFRTPHQRGELDLIGTGTHFSFADLDDAFVYVVADVDKSRAVVRFPKAGGPMAVVARDVRDAPIKVEAGELLFFHAAKPQVRGVRVNGGEPRVIADDEGFATVSAIEADAATIYVATGARESGLIVAIPRR